MVLSKVLVRFLARTCTTQHVWINIMFSYVPLTLLRRLIRYCTTVSSITSFCIAWVSLSMIAESATYDHAKPIWLLSSNRLIVHIIVPMGERASKTTSSESVMLHDICSWGFREVCTIYPTDLTCSHIAICSSYLGKPFGGSKSQIGSVLWPTTVMSDGSHE